MKLIIRDYLLSLKEKDELDTILCDLCFQMGYTLSSIPKTGNRQYGVDISASNTSEVLLFVCPTLCNPMDCTVCGIH